MKNKNILWTMMAAASVTFFAACDKDDNGVSPVEPTYSTEKYIVAASGANSIYLLETDNIDSGTLTTQGAGVEVESATAWLFPKNKYAYRLVYAQGNAGTGNSYELDENGSLAKRSIDFSITNRFTTYGIYGDYLICAASGATDQFDATDTNKSYPQYGVTFTYLDVENQTLNTKTIVTENLLGDGEYYTISGIVESNGKFFTGLCSQGYSPYGVNKYKSDIEAKLTAAGENVSDIIKTNATTGLYSSIGSTLKPNQMSVAIYTGTSFENPTIITDERLSFPTSRFRSQFYSTIAASENGDVYVFTANNAGARKGIFQSTTPSGAIRIKSGTSAFDQNYFCNITELSGGRAVYKVWNITGNYFLLQMYAEPGYYGSGMGQNTNRLAILNADTKDFKWVTGMPDDSVISSLGGSPYFEKGKAYMPVVFSAGTSGATADYPAVYIIDALTGVATKGLTVESDGGVSAIGKLRR